MVVLKKGGSSVDTVTETPLFKFTIVKPGETVLPDDEPESLVG